jgi:quercetin dioxygenase-like cupin family protein
LLGSFDLAVAKQEDKKMKTKVIVLRNLERKLPTNNTSRVRNYRARSSLGSESTTVFENILGINAFVPWHKHETEEVIIPFDGEGECETEDGVERFGPGETVIIPIGVLHTVRNVGAEPLRVLTVFPTADVKTFWKDPPSSENNGLQDTNA